MIDDPTLCCKHCNDNGDGGVCNHCGKLHAPVTITEDKPAPEYKPFGSSVELLAKARRIATLVVEDWGQDTGEAMERIRAGNIWNDHPAVQAALMALQSTVLAEGETALKLNQRERDVLHTCLEFAKGRAAAFKIAAETEEDRLDWSRRIREIRVLIGKVTG